MDQNSISICLCCGSHDGFQPEFAVAANQLGRLIARQGWQLIYGGGNTGLMGESARAACQENGIVVGVIPKHLIEQEVAKFNLHSLIITDTMQERKKLMFINSDSIVFLPGGIGTLDEFFEILAAKQLGLHKSPIILLNINNYWNELLKFLDAVISKGFAGEDLRKFIHLAESPSKAVDILRDLME